MILEFNRGKQGEALDLPEESEGGESSSTTRSLSGSQSAPTSLSVEGKMAAGWEHLGSLEWTLLSRGEERGALETMLCKSGAVQYSVTEAIRIPVK